MEYTLVPVEPTADMINAGYAAMRKNACAERLMGMTAECGIYAAMLAAAPAPAWIPVSERLPTREDADSTGRVWTSSRGKVARTRWDWVQDNSGVYWAAKPPQQPPAPPTAAPESP